MTVTQAPVMPLEPVADGHPAARGPVPEADAAIEDVAVEQVGAPTISADAVAAHRAQVQARTVSIMHWSFIGVRILAFVGLVVLVYVAVSGNWVAQAADALNAWYGATVAPHMEIDLTPYTVPSLYDGLFGPIPQPAFVIAD